MEGVNRPIFIVGSPRSGTTLLLETLCNHRDLAYTNENVFRSRVLKDYDEAVSTKAKILVGIDRNRKLRILLCKLMNKTLHGDSTKPREYAPLGKYFSQYEYLTETDYTPDIIPDILSKISVVQKIFKRPRFISKSPDYTFAVRLLSKIFPDGKFVHIIRDGRAVAYSTFLYAERGYTSEAENLRSKILRKKYREDKSMLFNFGLAWQELVKKACEIKHLENESRYYEIRYERLVAEPKGTLKSILGFCELEWDKEFERMIPRINDMNVKWKHQLTEEQRQELEESTLPLRYELGYN